VTAELTGLCRDHSFESAEDVCGRCGAEYCELCLVYPFGPSKPLCKECAMAAGGVRAHVSRPAAARKTVRRRKKAFEVLRQARLNPVEAIDVLEVTDPMLHDPPTPAEEDLEQVAEPVTVPDDGTGFADRQASTAGETPQPPPATEPARGVAPPIDWSQPFG
jgi:hypothetical protein